MNVQIAETPQQIPGSTTFAVVVTNMGDEHAVRELQAIAKRDGLTLGDTAYRFQSVYYFAPVLSQLQIPETVRVLS